MTTDPVHEKLRSDIADARHFVLKALARKTWPCVCCDHSSRRPVEMSKTRLCTVAEILWRREHGQAYGGHTSSVWSLAVFELIDDGILAVTDDLKLKLPLP